MNFLFCVLSLICIFGHHYHTYRPILTATWITRGRQFFVCAGCLKTRRGLSGKSWDGNIMKKKERERGSFWNGCSRWRNSFCVSLGSIMHGCLGTEYYIYEFFIKRDRQQEGLGTVFLCEIESYVKTIGEIIYSCRPSGGKNV